LNVARRELDERRKGVIRHLLNERIDWDYLIEAAHCHGLIPLLHRHLTPFQSDIPTKEFESIRQAALANSQSVLYLVNQLQNLVNRFAEERLPVLAFKGPVLAQMAYREMSSRQAGDLDILIERKDFDRAKSVLESLGHRMTPQLTRKQEAAHLGFHCEVQFLRDNGFTVVDLHWSLSPKAFPSRLNTAEVINRAQRVSLGALTLNTFSTEDLILFQSLHGTKHYWPRLEWISSLSELISLNPKVEWTMLIERARNARLVRSLAMGLRLARMVGEVQIPEAVFSQVDPKGRMKKVAEEAMAALFTPQTNYRSLRAVRKRFRIMDRKRDFAASLLRVVFVPTLSDWEAFSLPQSLHFFYYVCRPFRLVVNYAIKGS
jgi:putative nucleotidyltransferase-like protein